MPVRVSFHDFIVFPFSERHYFAMSDLKIERQGPVLLVGGAVTDHDILISYGERAAAIVAADSGADAVMAAGLVPDAVIGDMDSISAAARVALPASRVHEVTEQDSTDFEKCLRVIEAPLVLCLGFLGERIDHALAAMTVLARYPARRCLLVGASDAVTLLPPRIALDVEVGTRVSLWPLGPVTGRSEGLRWPIAGLEFAPHGTVGTSNEATGPVTIEVSAPRMLAMLPASEAGRLEAGLAAAEGAWPARG